MDTANTQLSVKKSDVSSVNSGGRPTKYTPGTVDRLLEALADGLNIGQACKASGISDKTLADWRNRHPELLPRLEAAREASRQKALGEIQKAGANDWRAWEAFLKYSFWKDYRQQPSVQVNATATSQAAAIVSEDQRKRLIELREKILHGAITTAQSPRGLTENGNEQTSAPASEVKRLPTNPAEPSPAESNPATEFGSDTWGLDHPDLT